MEIGGLCEALSGTVIGSGASDIEVVEQVRALVLARNMIDHHLASCAGELDRRGTARRSYRGGTTRQLLIEMGLAPSIAVRLIRVAAARGSSPKLSAHAADGALSGEHVDAIVRGQQHIARRQPGVISDEVGAEHEKELLAQAFSGATPAAIMAHARRIGNRLAADHPDGVPAADDRRLNSFGIGRSDDGRVEVRADLDVVVGEKLMAAIEALAAPRSEPDGSADLRSAPRRRADALDQILDIATHSDVAMMGLSRAQILLTIPVATPGGGELQWLGAVSATTARLISCDGSVTEVVVDDEGVPLRMSRQRRLFTGAQRRAIVIRDNCCIKCGAPPGWAQVHHMEHWADGGLTDLDNGCLLCPSCHAEVHAEGWEVQLGSDRHPWLIPPVTIDPRRRPVVAHNRRTMTLEGLPSAC